jgi:hypothetical protein
MTESIHDSPSQEAKEKAILSALPDLPCPSCGANILEYHGFYNYCDEKSSLRERNYLAVYSGSIYLEHDEDAHETESHECRLEAYCTSCEEKLPWTVYEIRGIDGSTPENAKEIITRLIAESQGEDETTRTTTFPTAESEKPTTNKEVNVI